jgi:hypothetical protein
MDIQKIMYIILRRAASPACRPGQTRHDDECAEAIVRVQGALGTVRGCRALCWTSSGDPFRPDHRLVLRQCVVRAVCVPSALSIPWRSSFGSSIPGSDPRTFDPQASSVAIRRYRGSVPPRPPSDRPRRDVRVETSPSPNSPSRLPLRRPWDVVDRGVRPTGRLVVVGTGCLATPLPDPAAAWPWDWAWLGSGLGLGLGVGATEVQVAVRTISRLVCQRVDAPLGHAGLL